MNAASERRFTVTTHDRLCAFCLFLLFSYTLCPFNSSQCRFLQTLTKHHFSFDSIRL